MPRSRGSKRCSMPLIRSTGTGPAQRAPAMGRYAGDVYYSGGAYYFSTLARPSSASSPPRGRSDARHWIERGDAYLETVRAYTPPNGDMSEQFDQRTGAQTSARHLAWSYAAFISCVAARRAVPRHVQDRTAGLTSDELRQPEEAVAASRLRRG